MGIFSWRGLFWLVTITSKDWWLWHGLRLGFVNYVAFSYCVWSPHKNRNISPRHRIQRLFTARSLKGCGPASACFPSCRPSPFFPLWQRWCIIPWIGRAAGSTDTHTRAPHLLIPFHQANTDPECSKVRKESINHSASVHVLDGSSTE